MNITLIIVGGLVLMTIFASGFDYLAKKKKGLDKTVIKKVEDLENRIKVLELSNNDKDERIHQLESDLGFLHKLIENKQ